MKICHVNYYAERGGAAIANLRLHQALMRLPGVESLLAVVDPGCRKENVVPLASPLLRQKLHLEQCLLWNVYRLQRSSNGNVHLFNLWANGLDRKIAALAPDVLHFHGIIGEMLSLGEIAALARRFPVVWTLHDCWPFTGSEQHFRNGSRRYVDGYSRANREDPGLDWDRMIWQRKKKLWEGLPVSFIAPSPWIGEACRRSALWGHAPVYDVGNAIDTAVFHPADAREARRRLGLPPDAKLLGFGASDLANPNKGGRELLEILRLLRGTGIGIVTMGSGKITAPLPVYPLGYLAGERQKNDFYNGCDLFLSVSKHDNLPNTILEAMACGTPVASFANGGIPALVREDNGIPVSGCCVPEMAEKIRLFFERPDPGRGERAREHIVSRYSAEKIAEQHVSVYRKVREYWRQNNGR